ncbi:hypothetical protein OV203_20130 [Nannocystis sp. ILAH1]|uniref:McrB family protein n=1 Tax=Nannocystis sp. ILAH1 TaxID=2996789 RepID=UPI00226FC5BF|nr:hypothetical protein [Nannocystis sp. ILAH1]MCY0989459.1 hypothetical protein [Nannocystis sp. ILAH1]
MPPVDLTAPAPSYWKIAPGEKAVNWPDCLKGGYISIGYHELSDLTGLSKAQFDARRDALLQNDPNYADFSKFGINMVWRFSQIPVGARIVANRGHYEVLGIGTVIRPYYYDVLADFPHRLGVRWDDTVRRSVAFTHWNSTLIALNRDDFLKILTAPPRDGQQPASISMAVLDTVLRSRNRSAPSVTFERITQALARGGYHFPDELVASYLLALQTKRFVILSGISGTGKTQLALQVGKAMTASRLAALSEDDPPPKIALTRDDLDRARVPLPPDVLARFPRFVAALERNAEVMLSTHDDTREQSTLVDRRVPHRPVLVLQDAAAEWLISTFRPGQLLALDIDEDATPPSVFLLPASPTDTARTVEVVPVRPDWTDHRGLLGFYNPLTQRYQATPFLRMLLAARDELGFAGKQNRLPRPFFAILDEMNLARVEHYFADFLSCLESGEPLHLHDDPRLASGDIDGAELLPTHLEIPRNVFITGTVNVDETTYMFSPKVLDRAFVFEFNAVDLGVYGRPSSQTTTPLRLTRAFPDPFAFSGNPTPDDWAKLVRLHGNITLRPLQAVHDALRRDNRHFGFRVANEIARFVLLAAEQADDAALQTALDIAVLSKVLPKLHGTQQELGELMTRLFAICVNPEDPKSAPPIDQWEPLHDRIIPRQANLNPLLAKLPRSAAKLWRMHRRLNQQGFVSFIE